MDKNETLVSSKAFSFCLSAGDKGITGNIGS